MSILFNPNPSVSSVLTLVVTVLLPLVVGLVTKASWSSGMKAILLLALSALTALGSQILAVHGQTDLWPMIQDTVITFVIAVATYYGLYKPTTIAAKAQAILVSDVGGGTDAP